MFSVFVVPGLLFLGLFTYLINERISSSGQNTAPTADKSNKPDWTAPQPAKPITMGSVVLAVILGNIACGVLGAVLYAVCFAAR